MFIAMILGACLADSAVVRKIDQTYDGQHLALKQGQALVLSLPGNPTTGYRWQLVDTGSPQLELLAEEVQPLDETGQRVGAGAIFRFRFKAVTTGEAAISLIYARPWEKDRPPADRFSLQLSVE